MTRTFEVKVGLTDPPPAMLLGATVTGRMEMDAVPVIDALVNKQIIHRNKAARHKSRLSAQIRAMQ